MSTSVNSRGKGRPALSPVVKAKRRAITAIKAHNEISSEFDIMLGVTPDNENTTHAKSVRKVAESRINVSREIEKINKKISSFDNSKEKKPMVKLLKAQRKVMYDQYNALPDIGFTFGEWKEIPESEKKKNLGRPKLSIELRLIRAEEERVASMNDLNKILLEDGKQIMDEDTLLNTTDESEIMIEAGRPKLDRLGFMDRELKRLRIKIDHITSGNAHIEQEEKIERTKRSAKTGKILGRPFEDLDEKLARFREEEASMLSIMKEIEDNLDAQGKIDRQLKLTRDQLRQHKANFKSLSSNSSDSVFEKMIKEQSAIEDKISSLVSLRAMYKDEAPVVALITPTESVANYQGKGLKYKMEEQEGVPASLTIENNKEENKKIEEDAFKAKMQQLQDKTKEIELEYQGNIDNSQAMTKAQIEEEELRKIMTEMDIDPDDILSGSKKFA